MVLTFNLVACAHRDLGEKPVKLEKKKEKELLSALDSMNHQRPTTLYTKIKCTYSDTTQNMSFKTSLRMLKDSAIDPLISKLNLPVAGVLITPDSVKIANKMNRCFIVKDLSYFKETFNVDFSFKNIEELILGLPIDFDTTQKYFQINDPFNYIISSAKKREIRRETRDRPTRDRNGNHIRREDEMENNVIIQYFLNSDLRSVKRIFLDSPDDTTTIRIDYLSRDSISTYLIPNEVHIEIVTPRNHIVLDMDYGSSEVDVPQEIIFTIPEGYEACGIKQDEE
jgi:hypothetical protein